MTWMQDIVVPYIGLSKELV